MGNITLNKPSGGQLTIAPEDGTSNEILNITPTGFPKQSGEIVQVKHSDIMPSTAGSTGNVVTLGTMTFTPKYANSYIYLQVLGGKMNHNVAVSGTHIYYFYRDGTQLTYRHQWASTGNYDQAHNMFFVDTPNSTNTLTYSYSGQADSGGWLVHDHNQPTRMTIWEVAQ